MRLLAWLLLVVSAAAGAEQQFATLTDFRFEDGTTLSQCRIGYRTFGTLDAGGANAVLFPTWFSGRSADLEALIGPGRLIDSSRFYVIAVDALGNGVSSSPTNTPAPFPSLTIGDMVHAQHRLLSEHLGVRRLWAVAGISMGGMQTFEWLVRYPDFLQRAVPIIGSPRLASTDLLLWHAQLTAIETARQCAAEPRAIMRAVLAMHFFALSTPARRATETAPADFAALLQQIGERAASGMHPDDWAAQLRAMIGHDVSRRLGGSMQKAAAAVRAPALVVVATQDHMVHPQPALDFARLARLDRLELTGDCGHMATSCEQETLRQAVAAFLTQRAARPPL